LNHASHLREYRARPGNPDDPGRIVAQIQRGRETALINDSDLSTPWILAVDGVIVGMFTARHEALAGLNRFERLQSQLVELVVWAVQHVLSRSIDPMYYGENGFFQPVPALAAAVTYQRGIYLLYGPAIDQGDGSFPGTSDQMEATSDLLGLCLSEIHERYTSSTVAGWTMADEMEPMLDVGLQRMRLRRDLDAQANSIIADVMRRMGQA